MRIRIQTSPPFPECKCWFIPSSQSILGLKTELSTRLLPLASWKPKELVLSMDGFDIMDDTPFEILRDGDLIVISRKGGVPSGVSRIGMKRKRAPSPSSSDVSSSSETSSSDSESDSESDSSSTSSSSSSSPPSVAPAKQKKTRQVAATIPSSSVPPTVPPGQGKPSTTKRNKRRRLLKQSQKQPVPPPSTLSEINSIPLGSRVVVQKSIESAVVAAETPPQSQLTMFSLKNKNKSKNFRKSLGAGDPLSRKIVFDSSPSAGTPAAPYLVPPSEKQDLGLLPANMNKKKEAEDWEEQWNRTQDDDIELELDYGPPEDELSPSVVDWDAAAKTFESSISITDASKLMADNYITWKELGLNYTTFTPEMVLQVARIISFTDTELKISVLPRPGSPEDEPEEERILNLNEALQSGLRALQL
ncbi:hypothetical protein DL96DRAFT_1787069 [Flagelloscypha sp. PMI_526]|nr:hypothetical protein DL96DRAFT_1787069 [Flagelloscypha sp. PMI_526]